MLIDAGARDAYGWQASANAEPFSPAGSFFRYAS